MSIIKKSLLILLTSVTVFKPAESSVKELTNMKDLQAVLNDESMDCIIMCYTNWCPACKGMKPVFKTAAEKFKGKANFAQADVSKKELDAAVESFGIQGIPTIIYKTVGFKNRDKFDKQLTCFLGATEPAQKKPQEAPKNNGRRRVRGPNQSQKKEPVKQAPRAK